MSNYLEVETARKKYTKIIRLIFFIPITITVLVCIPLAIPTYVNYYDVQQQDTVHMRLNFEKNKGEYFKNRKEKLWKLKFDTPVDSANFTVTMYLHEEWDAGQFNGQLDTTGYRGVFKSDDTTYNFNFRLETARNN